MLGHRLCRPILLGADQQLNKGKAKELDPDGPPTTTRPERSSSSEGSDKSAERRPTSTSPPRQAQQPHKDEGQVRLDVNRSFVSYPAGENDIAASCLAPELTWLTRQTRPVADLTPDAKDELRERLQAVIVHVLRAYPALHYFQGYHDVSRITQSLLVVLYAVAD